MTIPSRYFELISSMSCFCWGKEGEDTQDTQQCLSEEEEGGGGQRRSKIAMHVKIHTGHLREIDEHVCSLLDSL